MKISAAQIRKEISSELTQAIAIGADKGTIVTSNGDLVKFQTEVICGIRFIHICGLTMTNVKDATAAAMLGLGYTSK